MSLEFLKARNMAGTRGVINWRLLGLPWPREAFFLIFCQILTNQEASDGRHNV